MERALLCNAAVLAACCFYKEAPVFAGAEDVLEALTSRQMERLLQQLAENNVMQPTVENPTFDAARFYQLQEG